MSKNNNTNFLLVIIIVALALFILLCPRKTYGPKQTTAMIDTFEYNSDVPNPQNKEYYLEPEELEHLLVTNMKGSDEYHKNEDIMRMNAEYDTRGDNNDLINMNLLAPFIAGPNNDNGLW